MIVVPVVPVQFPSACVEKTVELPHCSRRALTMSSRSLVVAKMQVKVSIGSCVILGEIIEMSWVMFVGVWRSQCGESVFIDCREELLKPVEIPQVQFSDKSVLDCALFLGEY